MSHKYALFKYTAIGFIIAIVLFAISLFLGYGLIGGIIGFFIAGIIAGYKGGISAKNGAVQGLAIGALGLIVVFMAIMVVFGVPDFNYLIGDYGPIISSMNIPVELLIPISYVVASIIGGIIGSVIKR